jgi:DNA-binding CsgD family transcriptional regulator
MDLRRSDLLAVLDFVRQLHVTRYVDAFCAHVLRTLPRLVPSTITCYTELDPALRWTAALAEPAEAIHPDAARILAAHWDEHPILDHETRHPGSLPITISDLLSDREFHHRGIYAELYAPMRVERQLFFGQRQRGPRIAGFVLNRDRGRDFDERDRALLRLLQPHLLQAFENARLLTRLRDPRGGDPPASLARELVVLAVAGDVVSMSTRARRWLTEAFGPFRELPGPLARWIGAQLADGRGAVPPTRPQEPLVAASAGAQLRACVLRSPGGLLLVLERRAAPGRERLLSLGLTEREAEVLGWVAQGKTNREIALILAVARRTVAKHLERIFEKLAVETRTAAARVAFEGTLASAGADEEGVPFVPALSA